MKDANKLLDAIIDSLTSENDKIIASVSINRNTACLMELYLLGKFYAVYASDGVIETFDNLKDALRFYSQIKRKMLAL